MSTAEERLWRQLQSQLDRIENKLDGKVDYRSFDEFKDETNKQIEAVEKENAERFDNIDGELAALHKAAITPDQVKTLVIDKLSEEDARVVGSRDRWVRYGVAGASIATFFLLIYDRFYG